MIEVRCLIVAAALAGAVAHAEPPSAPSFSCSRVTAASAEATIERTICADPALAAQDRALEQAFRGAVVKPGVDRADLLDTQRAWLKARAAACGINIVGTAARDPASCLRDLYRDRVAALDTIDLRDGRMCRAIADHVREKGGFRSPSDLGDSLRADPTSPIVLGKAENVTEALVAALPNKPAPEDLMGLNSLFHFGAIRSLFAVVSVQGTAHCEYISLYKIVKGGAFATLDAPAALRDHEGNCGNATLFGSYAPPDSSTAPLPLYVDSTDAIGGSSLAFTVRRDEAWHPACTIATAFETELVMGRRFCAKPADCDALASRALDLARRRDAYGESAPARLEASPRMSADETKEQVELPTFGAPDVDAWASFESDAPVYAVAGPGVPLLMRISHGTVGWRTNENWLVGVYRREGETLVPLAGFTIAKSRTKLREVSNR